MTTRHAERPLRVIQWGTGHAGRPALRAIIRRPDLELVGVHAHAAEKIGRDAADLCGLDQPTGVVATDDVDALLALDADCVSYMVQGETRIRETVEELCRALASGKNVVNTALVFLVYPPFIDPGMRTVLKDACREGGSTLLTSGFDPGWSGDILPLALACVCERVESISVLEAMDYSTYPDPDFTGAFFGFGRPLDYAAPLFAPGAVTGGWGGMLQMVADALGWELEGMEEHTDRLPAPRRSRPPWAPSSRARARGALRAPRHGRRASGGHRRAREPPARRHRARLARALRQSLRVPHRDRRVALVHLRDRAAR